MRTVNTNTVLCAINERTNLLAPGLGLACVTGPAPKTLRQVAVIRKWDLRLMLAVVRAADNLRNCNYNDQHKDNPIGVLNDALDAFNKGARK